MKTCNFLLSLSFIFWSCKSTPNENHKPNFTGNWVLEELINNTYNEKSISRANQLSDFYITELVFNDNDDSVSIYNGNNSHIRIPKIQNEGTISLCLKENTSPTTLYFDKTDSTLFFADSSVNRLYRFIKAQDGFLDVNQHGTQAFPAYVNNAILEGTYSTTDNQLITFGRFGAIKNWDLYTAYEILLNDSLANNTSGDVVVLSKGFQKQLFGLRWKKNSLDFFELIPLKNKEGHQNGKLVYSFKSAS